MSRKLSAVNHNNDDGCTFAGMVEAIMSHRRLIGVSPKTLSYYAEAFRYVSNHGFPTELKSIFDQRQIRAMMQRKLRD